MRMKALQAIDRGKDKIQPGEEFEPDSKKEAEHLLKAGAAEMLEELKKTDPPAPPKKLSAEEAIAAIGKCGTIDQVKEFFKDEKRPTVIDAARAQIKAIKDAEKAAADKK